MMTTTLDLPVAPAGAAPDADTPAAAAPAGEPRRLLRPDFMLRVTGLPFESLASLRFAASLAWADEVLDGERRLAEAGAALSDLLHDAVADNEDESSRRALLALRRQVFKNKLPRDPEAALLLAETAAGAAGPALADWLRDRTRWERLRADGPTVLRAESASARDRLRLLAEDPKLRHGLLLASPSLDTALDTYQRKHSDDLDKRDRRTERALLEYVYRIAAKTSPFSTFTGVAVGEFTDGPAGGENPGVYGQSVPEQWHRHARVNVAVLSRLTDLIAANETLRADLPVSLTAGWRSDEDRLRYVRHTMMRGDDEASVAFDLVRDDVFFLRHGAALDGILELLEDAPDLRYGEFISRLGAASGAPAEDCERYADKLVQLGLLRAHALRIDIHHPDPLRDLATRLVALDRPWAADLAGRLDRIAAMVDRFAHAELPERRDLLHGVRTGFEEIHAWLGAPEAGIPRALIYEDARAGTGTLAYDRAQWTEQIARPLFALGSILPLFDLALAHRITLHGFFLARYGRGGRCEDLVKLVQEFHEDIYDHYLQSTRTRQAFDDEGEYVPHDNWLRQPEFTALDAARVEFTGHLRGLWRESADATEIELGDGILAGLAARLDPLLGRFRPSGHFIQVGRGEDGPIAVVNGSFSGLSFPFSRFTHCFQDLGPDGLAGRLRDAVRGIGPEGAVFAEITGGTVSTNLNLHGRLTDYQIVCPDEHSALPPQAQLPLADLYAEHDPDGDRLVLRSRRLGLEVIPLYLGYLMPVALPDVHRALLLFSPSSMSHLDLWAGVPAGPAQDGVTVRPRVRHRGVVLARRRWTVAAEALPAHRPDAPDDERLLDWRRWQRGHAIPDQVFARFGAAGDFTKPYHIDFGSWFSLGLLDARLKAGGGVVFEEMSPAEDELHVTSPAGRHVAELAIETAQWRDGFPTPGGTA